MMNLFADQLFDWFLSATIRGSLLFGAVLLIQFAFRDRLSAFWRHALWLPVVFVLASPILPESPWSLDQHFFGEESALTPAVVVSAPFGDRARAGSSEAAEAFPVIPVPAIEPVGILAWIWLIGAAVVFLAGFLAHTFVMRKARLQSVSVEPALREELEAAAASIRLRQVPHLLVSTAIESPAITGIFRPVLLLPANFSREFGVEERRLILLHELHHFRRGDLLVNALLFLLQSLHWCNPVVWLALNRFRADRELACDSAVLENAKEETRQVYGRALIKLSGTPRHLARSIGFVGMFGCGRELKHRVAAIAGYRRRSAWWSAPAMILITAMLVVGGTKAAQDIEVANREEVDVSGDQIKIQARFIVLESPDEQLTIEAERSTFDRENQVVTFVQDGDDLQSFFPEGKVKILASPTVNTLHGQKAVIETGESLASEDGGEEVETSLKLEVVPMILDGEIELKIELDSKQRVDSESGEDSPTSLFEEETKLVVSRIVSNVVLEPGQTVLLGGLMENEVKTLVAVTPEIPDTFDDIIIEKFEVQNMEIKEVLKLIQEFRSEQMDPAKLKEGEGHGIVLSGNPKTTPRITLKLENLPLSELLRYVTGVSGLTYRNVGNVIYIEAREEEPEQP